MAWSSVRDSTWRGLRGDLKTFSGAGVLENAWRWTPCSVHWGSTVKSRFLNGCRNSRVKKRVSNHYVGPRSKRCRSTSTRCRHCRLYTMGFRLIRDVFVSFVARAMYAKFDSSSSKQFFSWNKAYHPECASWTEVVGQIFNHRNATLRWFTLLESLYLKAVHDMKFWQMSPIRNWKKIES